MKNPIVIAGAGPAGALLATYLGRAGHVVTVFESRPDLRTTVVDAGRSINLALATRGTVPLIDIGVIEAVDAITVPMIGRMVHGANCSAPELQRYGTKPHEVIHSVSRNDLNAILLDAAEATGNVTIEFERRITKVDLESSTLHFDDGQSVLFGVVVGADGTNSPVRHAMATIGAGQYSTDRLDHSYKELTLGADEFGAHRLDPHALHIWPRGELMIIALANPSGDFTLTLFAPSDTFDLLDNPANVETFFATEFAELLVLVPDIVQQVLLNRTGVLGTTRSTGWSYRDRAVLLGDSAHGIVPFHGQGMNAAMESARSLAQHLGATPDDVAGAFVRFEAERKPSTDAIAEMALQNYVEMRSGVVEPEYLAKRALELELEQRYPRYFSPHYAMVMFSTMPFAEAHQRAMRQDHIMEAILADANSDVDALIMALEPLPMLDPLYNPNALSIS